MSTFVAGDDVATVCDLCVDKIRANPIDPTKTIDENLKINRAKLSAWVQLGDWDFCRECVSTLKSESAHDWHKQANSMPFITAACGCVCLPLGMNSDKPPHDPLVLKLYDCATTEIPVFSTGAQLTTIGRDKLLGGKPVNTAECRLFAERLATVVDFGTSCGEMLRLFNSVNKEFMQG